jgi:hypothetical protein
MPDGFVPGKYLHVSGSGQSLMRAKAGKTTAIPARAGIQDHARKSNTRIFEPRKPRPMLPENMMNGLGLAFAGTTGFGRRPEKSSPFRRGPESMRHFLCAA